MTFQLPYRLILLTMSLFSTLQLNISLAATSDTISITPTKTTNICDAVKCIKRNKNYVFNNQVSTPQNFSKVASEFVVSTHPLANEAPLQENSFSNLDSPVIFSNQMNSTVQSSVNDDTKQQYLAKIEVLLEPSKNEESCSINTPFSQQNFKPPTPASPFSEDVLLTKNARLIPISENKTTVHQDAKWLDVNTIDPLINQLEALAGHYPPRFANGLQHTRVTKSLEQLTHIFQPYLDMPAPSFAILYRTALVNQMARNSDMGETYQITALKAITGALKLRPHSGAANLLYANMIAESGGLVESFKFINQALAANQAMALLTKSSVYLGLEQPKKARDCLIAYQHFVPDDADLTNYWQKIESKQYTLWGK